MELRLNAWTWLIAGGIMSIVAGYIYLFVPKNGSPNTVMAFFFFIGILFMVIGVAQLFFKRADDKEVFESVKKSEEKNPEQIITIPTVESKPNKIDEEINQLIAKHEKPAVAHQTHAMHHPQSAADKQRMSHTNTYSQLHQYKGPVHTPSTGTHAQHPVSQHVQPHAPATQHATSQHRIQNVAEYSAKCGKCGNVNAGHSNYCHQCGNRLK